RPRQRPPRRIGRTRARGGSERSVLDIRQEEFSGNLRAYEGWGWISPALCLSPDLAYGRNSSHRTLRPERTPAPGVLIPTSRRASHDQGTRAPHAARPRHDKRVLDPIRIDHLVLRAGEHARDDRPPDRAG